MFFISILFIFFSANVLRLLNQDDTKQNDKTSLVLWEIEFMSLWFKQDQISANKLRKLNLIQREIKFPFEMVSHIAWTHYGETLTFC